MEGKKEGDPVCSPMVVFRRLKEEFLLSLAAHCELSEGLDYLVCMPAGGTVGQVLFGQTSGADQLGNYLIIHVHLSGSVFTAV